MTPLTTLNEKKIKLIVDKIQNLPTPPIVFTQISKVINDPDNSAYEIGGIISEDPALTAKILKLTNSSFYGIPRKITNVKQAIVILGLDTVKLLVLSSSVFDTFIKNKILDEDYLERFWRHSLSVAFMTKIISRADNAPSLLEVEQGFSAGLLHDIGKLIIVSYLPNKHAEIKKLLEDDMNMPEIMAEEKVLGFSHTELGGFMAAKWNLPESICLSILNHHSLESPEVDKDTAKIHLSNYLAHEMEFSNGKNRKNVSQFSEIAWSLLDVDPSQESQLIDSLRQEYTKAETFMKIAQELS